MADDTDQDSKTEAPSGKRLEEAADRGEFAKSPEIQVFAMLIAVVGMFSMMVTSGARDVAEMSQLVWGNLGRVKLQLDTAPQELAEVGLVTAKVLGPIIGVAVLATLVAGGLQTGFRMSPKAIGFKLAGLNPVSGFQRIFSKAAAVRAGVDFLKLLAIGGLLWVAAKKLLEDPIFTAPVEVQYLGDFLRRSTLEFLGKVILALGVVATLSYAYERHKRMKDMMMTKQEVKDEHKQSEGDGQTKAAIRRMGRRLIQKQMLAAVPTADVVVTNPTHYAVALKYERGKDGAPVVLAKGENGFARRIKDLAREHGVPMVENKPVARMLYAVGKVGEQIPAELFQAVAEILAFVYRTHRLYFHELKIRRASAEAAAKRRVA